MLYLIFGVLEGLSFLVDVVWWGVATVSELVYTALYLLFTVVFPTSVSLLGEVVYGVVYMLSGIVALSLKVSSLHGVGWPLTQPCMSLSWVVTSSF